MNMKLLGGIKLCVKGVNQERNFNSLIKDVEIYNLKRTSHTNAEFCVKFKNYKNLTKNLKKHNFEVINQKKYGFIGVFSDFLKRWGIIFALCFFAVGFIVFSNFVFSTQIIGLEKIEYSNIKSVLQQNNYVGLILKDSINTKQVENIIMDNFDNISLVSVMIKGNTLVVSIKEKVINDEYENKDNFKPLLSKYSGLITDINLIQGTLKVQVGDIVKVGDVLVEAFIYDSSHQKQSIEPKAEITAKVWYVGKENHFSVRLETVRTGNVKTISYLTFMGLFLSTPPSQTDLFANYESITSVSCISNNNILPIYRHLIVYYETEKVQIEEDFESVKENILQKAKQKALQLVEEYDIISKEYFNMSTVSNVTFVEYVIEVTKRIDIL